MIIPMAFLMARLFGMTGVWLSYPAAEGLAALMGILFYCLGRPVDGGEEQSGAAGFTKGR